MTKKYTLSAQSLAVTYTAQSLAFAIKTADVVGGTSIAASNLRFSIEQGFFVRFIRLFDNSAVSDSEMRAFFKGATDSSVLADAATTAFVKARADTAATADEIVFATFKALADTATVTDAATAAFTKSPNDTIQATDDVDGAASILDDQEIQYFKTRTNIAVLTDEEKFDSGKSQTNQLNVRDEIVMQRAYERAYADAYSASEVYASLVAKPASDSAGVTDTVSGRAHTKLIKHEIGTDEVRWFDNYSVATDRTYQSIERAFDAQRENVTGNGPSPHMLLNWLRSPNPDTGRLWGDWLDDGEWDRDTVAGGEPQAAWLLSTYMKVINIWGRILNYGAATGTTPASMETYLRDVFIPNYPHVFIQENHTAQLSKSVSDVASLTDTPAKSFGRSAADAGSVTDTRVSTFTSVRGETTAAQDAYTRSLTKAFFETPLTSDVLYSQVDYVRAFTDTATVTDDLDGSASILDDQELQFVKDRTNTFSAAESKSLGLEKLFLETPSVTDAGSLLSQGFADFNFFAEDFVGASRTFT